MKFLDWTKIFYALSILAAVEGCARTAPGEGELTTLGPDDTTPLPSGATTMPGSDSTTTPDGDVTSGSTAAPTTESTTAMTSTSTGSSSSSSSTTTIGSGSNYYTMDQYKNGACNTFHTGAEPASFTSQEQWDYLVGADGKIVIESSLWIGLEFDATGNLAWINGQPVTWVRAPAALDNTGTPGFAFDDNWVPDDPENPTAGFPDRTIICRAPPPP